MTRTTGHFDIIAVALDQIHHGAGVSGNTALLRMEESIHPETLEHQRTPFISGGSLKSMIRRAGVRFAIEAMGTEPQFSRPVIDLLMSGGALSKGGSAVKLGPARRLEALFPILAVMGYSAGNRIETSRLRCDDLRLICEENEWRLSDRAKARRQRELPAGAYISDGFGTRKDPRTSVEARLWLNHEDKAAVEDGAETQSKKKQASGEPESTQMIYDHEVLMPGSAFWGAWYFYDLGEMELAALQSAISRACVGTAPDGGYVFEVGAMSRRGKGRVSMHFEGSLRADIRPAQREAAPGLVRFGESGSRLDAYITHLRDNRDEILAALQEVVS